VKLLMNCDQVFDVLTRGPFPTGDDSDEAVERHLRACHECRQLAEALQPAVEMLHESIARDEAADLPEYQGALMAIERSVATAEELRPRPLSIQQLARTRAGERRQTAWTNFAQFAVVVMLFAAVGSLAWNVITTAKHRPGQSELIAAMLPAEATAAARLDEQGLLTLAALKLPERCFPHRALLNSTDAKSQSAAISQDALRCCTECHHSAKSARPAPRLIAAMKQSCTACHTL
jgi:hypothetical protein